MQQRPYKVGSFRPDLLIDSAGKHRLCEINARFTTNGYYITRQAEQAVCQLDGTDPQFPDPATTFDGFDPTEPIAFVKGREFGNDCHLMQLERPGLEFVDPGALRMVRGRLHGPGGRLRQVMLELHQDEIEALPLEVVEGLADPDLRLLNDLRTIFLVHDKRFLTLLSDPALLAEFLPAEDAAWLQKRLIPTFSPDALPERLREEVRSGEAGYLVKPALAGKGEGIVFSDELSAEEWRAALDTLDGHIVQPIVDQQLFRLQSALTGEAVEQPLVATFCCVNDRYLGPGIFRSGPQRLIAVSRGGEILVPRVAPPRGPGAEQEPARREEVPLGEAVPAAVPLEVACPAEGAGAEHLAELTDALFGPGAAVVRLGFADPAAAYMSGIVTQIGDFVAHDGDSGSMVWDVRPQPEAAGAQARSHGAGEFRLHTDGSFERCPPRLMALQCLREDRKGGGYSQLVAVDEVLSRLPERHVRALREGRFTITVPPEFHKGEDETHGPLLTRHGELRYRYDIIDRARLQRGEKDALEALEAALGDLAREAPRFTLQEGSVLWFDNTRFLHARTEIKDAERHLKRIRFHPKNAFGLPAIFDG